MTGLGISNNRRIFFWNLSNFFPQALLQFKESKAILLKQQIKYNLKLEETYLDFDFLKIPTLKLQKNAMKYYYNLMVFYSCFQIKSKT
jgi:hypothetical protein